METTIEFNVEVNAELEFAFRTSVEEMLAGCYAAEDKEFLNSILEDMKKPASEWNEWTRNELANFLMIRAGFNSTDGKCATDFAD